MDDRDLATLCVYAMWDMADSDYMVQRMVNNARDAAGLRKLGETIVANPHRSKASLRIFTHAVANRLEGK